MKRSLQIFKLVMVLLCITILYPNKIFAQQSVLDSLFTLLPKYKAPDTLKARLLGSIAFAYHEVSPDSTIYYADQTIALSEKLGYKWGIAKGKSVKSIAIYLRMNYDEAVLLNDEALKLYTELGNEEGLAAVYNNLAIINHDRGMYNQALIYNQRAMQMRERIKDWKGVAASYNNIANVYFDLGDYTKSLVNHFKGLALRERYDHKSAIASSFANISAIYFEINTYEKSLYYAQKAMKLFEEERNNDGIFQTCISLGTLHEKLGKPQIAKNYFMRAIQISDQMGILNMDAVAHYYLGQLYISESKFDSAYEHLNLSYHSSEKLQDKEGLSLALSGLANVFYHRGDYKQAREHLVKAAQIANEIGNRPRIYEANELLAKVYEKMNDHKSANYHLRLYLQYKDSLFSNESAKKMYQLEFDYLTQKNLDKIALLEKDKQIQEDRTRNNRIIGLLLVGLVFLLITLIVFLYKKNRQEVESKQIIIQQKGELEFQAVHLEELNTFKDKAFSVISHDLRSPLATLTSLIDMLDNKMLTPEEFVQLKAGLGNQLKSINMLLENLLMWAKNNMSGGEAGAKQDVIVNELVLQSFQLFARVAEEKRIKLLLDVPENLKLWCDRNQLDIAIRNLVNNAIKYSNVGGAVEVQAKQEGQQIIIQVKDQGKGMSSEQLNKLFTYKQISGEYGIDGIRGAGIGLILTKEFVEKNNGKITVQSEPEKGTVFTLTFVLA